MTSATGQKMWPDLLKYNRAVTASDYTTAQRIVLFALGTHASVKGELFVSSITLAIETGLSPTAVSAALSVVMPDGWAERTHGGYEGEESHYALSIPEKAHRTLKDNPDTGTKRELYANQNRKKQQRVRDKRKAKAAEHPPGESTYSQQEGVLHPGGGSTTHTRREYVPPGGGSLNNPGTNPVTDPSTASAAEPPHARQSKEEKTRADEDLTFQPPVPQPRRQTGPGRSRAWKDAHPEIAARAEGPPSSHRNVITLSRRDSRRTALPFSADHTPDPDYSPEQY